MSIDELASFNTFDGLSANLKALKKAGGIAGKKGLEGKLKTSLGDGLNMNEAEIQARREALGGNKMPEKDATTFFALFYESFEDATVVILLVSAAVSLCVGMYENIYTGWIEGVAIFAAVLIVALVTAVNNFEKEKQFRALSAVQVHAWSSILESCPLLFSRIGEIHCPPLSLTHTTLSPSPLYRVTHWSWSFATASCSKSLAMTL
jgi:hypothetical protein